MVTLLQMIWLNQMIAIMSAVDIIHHKEGSTALLTFPKDENKTGDGWCLFDSEKYLHSNVIFQFQNGRYVNLANTPKYMIFNKERSKWFQLQIKNLTLDDAGTYVCKWSLDGSRYDIELHVLMHIAEGSSLQLVEGHRLNLTCTVDDETNVNVEWLYLDENGNLLNLHQSNKTFILQTVTRNDAGVYQCQATNRIGNSSSTVNITIQYPPAVELVVSEDFIECILHQGIPASNNLFQLEHQSVLGVHIREIQSFSSDKLLLLKSYIPYETNEIYVCQASNGVVDVDGIAIHNKSTIFKHSGRPVFSNENTNVLYGELGKPFLMKFIIYSFPILQELRLQKKFGNHSTNQTVRTDQTMKSLLSYTEYDTEEKIPGYEVIYETNILTNEDLTVYNLWAKNSFGESFYMYKIIALDKVNKSRHMTVHFFVSVSISALLVLYIGVSHFYCFIRFLRLNRLEIIQQEHSYDEIDVVPYELDSIQQHVGDVHQQRHDDNFIDSNVSRRNVTDNTSNSTMQLLQTRPTDTHRIDYENMYQPIVRERNDSHCYSQYLPDVLDKTVNPHYTGSYICCNVWSTEFEIRKCENCQFNSRPLPFVFASPR